MTKTEWCDYGDLPTDQCAHCRGVDLEDDESEKALTGGFRAQYAGTCARCGGRFDVGDRIHRSSSGYSHDDLGACG